MGAHEAPDPALLEALRAEMEKQPWYRRFANTVSTGVGVVTMVVWILVSSGIDIPKQVTDIITAVIAILTLLGVVKTPNGLTPRGLNQVESILKRG